MKYYHTISVFATLLPVNKGESLPPRSKTFGFSATPICGDTPQHPDMEEKLLKQFF